jgi:hypothetical protein
LLDVSARPDKRMNMSSTPIPKNSTSYYIICPCLIPFPIIIYKAGIYTYIFQKRFFYYHLWIKLAMVNCRWKAIMMYACCEKCM